MIRWRNQIPSLNHQSKERQPGKQAMDFSTSPSWPELVKLLKTCNEIYFPDNTHFLPMEIPDKIIEILKIEIAEVVTLFGTD